MTDLVTLNNGKATTTSLLVAETFEKQHDKIMRDIKNLLTQVPEEWGTANFGETPYTHPQNGQTYTMYILTRDAFTLLAMGFTGKKAMQFKLAYIDAFNRMEAELKKQQEQQALPQETQDTDNQISTVNERVRINNLVKRWAKSKKKSHFECWKIIHKEFDISTIAMLPSNKVSAVCDFILDKIDNPAERPTPPPLPEAVQSTLPAAKPQLTFLPAEQKLPPLMFEYEPDYFAEFHAKKMLNEYDYKPYAYNAYMLSCKACDIFNDFEQKIKQLMKDYDKISKPVYEKMFLKITDGDSERLSSEAVNRKSVTKKELRRHGDCVNHINTMYPTIDSTYSKLMYSRSDYLRNEVDQMIQTLRHTAKVLDM